LEMTNEELVLLIQQGDNGLLPQLWEQVRRFVVMMARRHYEKFENKHGCELDDLIQSGYFGLLAAIKYYKPEKGLKFISYLELNLKTAFNEAMGVRGYKRDWLDFATSLDTPVGEGETALIDMLGDMTPGAGDVIETVVEDVFNQELRAALDDAMTILTEKQRELLVLHYYFNMSIGDIAQMRERHRQQVDEQRNSALWKIYNSKHRYILQKFMPHYGDRINPYRGTGYLSWKETGYNVEEAFLIK